MRSTKPKIRRKKSHSSYKMKFVTAVKRSGSIQIKEILVPSGSATVSAETNSDSQSMEAVVDHNNECMCPDTIGD